MCVASVSERPPLIPLTLLCSQEGSTLLTVPVCNLSNNNSYHPDVGIVRVVSRDRGGDFIICYHGYHGYHGYHVRTKVEPSGQ